MFHFVIQNIASRQSATGKQRDKSRATVEAILDAANPVQRAFYAATDRYSSLICPRRAGKTFAIIAKALKLLEEKPNSRFMLVSTNATTARKNYWLNAPGGVPEQLKLYGIEHRRNDTLLTWQHANGSVGMLVGVEDMDGVEKIRGAQAEVDLAVVDECQSIKPFILEALLNKVIGPGLMTRKGSVILAGTPGTVAAGPWYQATHPEAKNADGKYTCRTVLDTTEVGHEGAYWARWHWTIQDNLKAPEQWADALATKALHGWNDANPTWQREYLGYWVVDASELVYNFAKYRDRPDYVTTNEPDMSQGVWHTVAGLDYGFEDATAVVVMAYSEEEHKVYNLYNFKAPHMMYAQIGELLQELFARYKLTAIAADTSGKGFSESFKVDFGLPIEAALKTAKNDYIEKVNSDFQAGRIKILRNSELDEELCSLPWDLRDGTKAQLAAAGKLKEDKRSPNHLCDAFLYAMRHCMHQFAVAPGPRPATLDPDLKAAMDAARVTQGPQGYDQAYHELAQATQALREFGLSYGYDDGPSGYPGLFRN